MDRQQTPTREFHKHFTVNDSDYAVESLTPNVAHRFGLKVAAVAAPIMPLLIQAASSQSSPGAAFIRAVMGADLDADKIESLCEEARRYLILPDNTPAKQAGAFDAWFTDHPRDMYQVSLTAVWKLVEDFFPSFQLTTGTEPPSNTRPGSPSAFPTDGKAPPSSAESASRAS
jgi:hypothetical protein